VLPGRVEARVAERLGDDVTRRPVLGREGRVQTAEAVRADLRDLGQLAQSTQVVEEPVAGVLTEQPIGRLLVLRESLPMRAQERWDLQRPISRLRLRLRDPEQPTI